MGREKTVNVRLDDDELRKIEKAAKKDGRTVADYLRRRGIEAAEASASAKR